MLKRLAVLIAVFAAFAAKAEATSYSPRVGLLLMSPGVTNWGIRLNNEVFSVIDSSAAWLTATNDFQSSNTFHAGVLFVNSAITMTGAGGFIVNNSSISTNGGFFGNCWGCTNINPAALPVTVITGTGTANQFSYFDSTEHITSTGAATIIGTTIRFGNRGTPLPTSDVHVVIGDGPRAFNLNLAEDPVYAEIAMNSGELGAIGFSVGGTQGYIVGKSAGNNFLLNDVFVGGGLGIFFKHFGGTQNSTFGNPSAGEGSILTPTVLGMYGVFTAFGTAASQPVAAADQGRFYFSEIANHHIWFSEDGNPWRALPGILLSGNAPTSAANQIAYFTSESVLSSTSAFQFSGTSVTLNVPVLFNSTATANFLSANKMVIGATNPTSQSDLTIIQTTNIAGLTMDHYSNDNVGTAFIGRKAEGTLSAPTAVAAGDRLATFGGNGFDGSANFPSSSTARIVFIATEPYTSTAHGSFTQILTTPSGSTTPVVSATFGPGDFSGGNGHGFYNINTTSCTSIPNTTFTNTAFGPAISTITIANIRAGSHVRVSFSGQAANNTSADGIGVTILQDGAFTTSIGNAAIVGFNNSSLIGLNLPSTAMNISFGVPLDTPALTAGSHSWAFAPAVVTGGTGTLIKSATVNNRFCVTEEP